jgi:RND family efflux transporter MFP subunit
MITKPRSLAMPLTRKAVALSLGLSAILSAVTIAQNPKQNPAETLVIEDSTVDWFQKSDVSALREGVIDTMELRVGKDVGKKNDIIGYLHKEVADLSVEEARIQAQGEGAILKAKAQRELALTVVARNIRLLARGRDMVSQEDNEKAKAEYAAADAALIEAQDTQRLAKAKLKSAERAAEEHIIRAPFAGRILEEFKHEGESVRANEPVVRIGNLDTVRVWAYIPLEYAFRVNAGTEIIIQPRLGNTRGRHPIEQKQFRGVITSVDQSIQPVAETAVRIYADLDNPDHELKPGLKATMTIMLKPEGAVAGPNQASNGPAVVGARQGGLPPMPPR